MNVVQAAQSWPDGSTGGWCYDWISSVARKAGVTGFQTGANGQGAQYSEAKNNGRFISKQQVYPGALVFYGFRYPDLQVVVTHVDLVTAVNGNMISTMGSNGRGGSSNGFLVFRETRNLDTDMAVPQGVTAGPAKILEFAHFGDTRIFDFNGQTQPSNTLNSNVWLYQGDNILSPNRNFMLVQQNDGNLVLYDSASQPRWSSGTYMYPGSITAMQSDGNLVVYSRDGVPRCSTNTNRFPGAVARVQDDGNFVVVAPGNSPKWWSAGRTVC